MRPERQPSVPPIARPTALGINAAVAYIFGVGMASIPGSHYDVFAGSQTVNFGVTADPNNVPAPVSGDFNLEVVTNATGTGSFLTAPGYQGLAILSADGNTLTALH